MICLSNPPLQVFHHFWRACHVIAQVVIYAQRESTNNGRLEYTIHNSKIIITTLSIHHCIYLLSNQCIDLLPPLPLFVNEFENISKFQILFNDRDDKISQSNRAILSSSLKPLKILIQLNERTIVIRMKN